MTKKQRRNFEIIQSHGQYDVANDYAATVRHLDALRGLMRAYFKAREDCDFQKAIAIKARIAKREGWK